MLQPIQHESLSYEHPTESGALIKLRPKEMRQICRQHDIRTYRVGRREFLPAFELDRLITTLMRDEARREARKMVEGENAN